MLVEDTDYFQQGSGEAASLSTLPIYREPWFRRVLHAEQACR